MDYRLALNLQAMKTCSSCSVTKALDEFYARSGRCKSCISNYNKTYSSRRYQNHKEWVEKNPARAGELCKSYRQRRKRQLRELIETSKLRPCVDCGKSYPPRAMDFDHRSEEVKRMTIGESAAKGWSLATIGAEIAKCDIVCAACHRTRTFNRYDRNGQSRTVKRIRTLQSIVSQFKMRPCIDCGIQRQPHQTDLHHPNLKGGTISEMCRRRVSLARLLAELERCMVVCVICHRLRGDHGAHPSSSRGAAWSHERDAGSQKCSG